MLTIIIFKFIWQHADKSMFSVYTKNSQQLSPPPQLRHKLKLLNFQWSRSAKMAEKIWHVQKHVHINKNRDILLLAAFMLRND